MGNKSSKEPTIKEINVSTNNSNPFEQGPVTCEIVKEVDPIEELKEFREFGSVWNEVIVEELKKRSIKDLLRTTSLVWTNSDAFVREKEEKRLEKFLNDTSENKQLFRSFKINFPQAIFVEKLVQSADYFSGYSPQFVELALPPDFNKDYKHFGALRTLLQWMAPSLIELTISYMNVYGEVVLDQQKVGQLPLKLHFPHLRKIKEIVRGYEEDICRISAISSAFSLIFGNESSPLPLTHLDTPWIPRGQFTEMLGSPSRWTSLTHLNIGAGVETCSPDPPVLKLSSALLALAKSGVKLKELSLNLRIYAKADNFAQICRNLTEFLHRQSPFLELLDLMMNFNYCVTMPEEDVHTYDLLKINLPRFEALHTFKIDLYWQLVINNVFYSKNLFEMHSFPASFPALKQFELKEWTGIDQAGATVSPLAEERLDVDIVYCGMNDPVPELNFLRDNFKSVKDFSCKRQMIQRAGRIYPNEIQLPWGNSLKKLAYSTPGYCKLGNLEGLKELIIVGRISVRDFEVIRSSMNPQTMLDYIEFRGHGTSEMGKMKSKSGLTLTLLNSTKDLKSFSKKHRKLKLRYIIQKFTINKLPINI